MIAAIMSIIIPIFKYGDLAGFRIWCTFSAFCGVCTSFTSSFLLSSKLQINYLQSGLVIHQHSLRYSHKLFWTADQTLSLTLSGPLKPVNTYLATLWYQFFYSA